jgi:hypothetical protein
MGITPQHRSMTRRRLAGGLVGAVALAIAVIVSAWRDESGLGAPGMWPWLLTGLQVLALWSAGRGWWWGWLLGGLVQVPWIAYALMTGQIGFIPGCAVSTLVQFFAFTRNQLSTNERREIQVPQEALT